MHYKPPVAGYDALLIWRIFEHRGMGLSPAGRMFPITGAPELY